MRYVFNSPLSFAVEFGRYTFAGMVYLGSIYVMRDDGHIGLDIVVDALPQPLRTIVKKFSRVLVLAYLAVFFCMSTRMVMENWTNRSSTMHLPMSVVYLAMVIGSAGMSVSYTHLVGTNEVRLQLMDALAYGGGAAFQHRLAPAGNACISADLNKSPSRTHQPCLNFCDLHSNAPLRTKNTVRFQPCFSVRDRTVSKIIANYGVCRLPSRLRV